MCSSDSAFCKATIRKTFPSSVPFFWITFAPSPNMDNAWPFLAYQILIFLNRSTRKVDKVSVQECLCLPIRFFHRINFYFPNTGFRSDGRQILINPTATPCTCAWPLRFWDWINKRTIWIEVCCLTVFFVPMVGHLGKDDQKPNCGQIETEGEISIWKVHQELFTFTKHELDLVQLWLRRSGYIVFMGLCGWWGSGQWIVDDMRFQKIYGLNTAECH